MTFDFTGAPTGSYDLQVSSAGAVRKLAQAVTVAAVAPGQLETHVTSPAVMRLGRTGSVVVDYVNSGSQDMVAPWLTLKASNAQFLSGAGSFTGDTVQILASSPGAPAGILPPGAGGSFTATFKPVAAGWAYFDLLVNNVSQATLDWSGAQTSLKPAGVSDAGWQTIFSGFLADVGTTVGSFSARLVQDDTALSQSGEYLTQVSDFLSFEFNLAGDFGSLDLRNRLGALGWLWDDPTKFVATVASDGSARIIYPSGFTRLFYSQGGTSYVPEPGNYAQLTVEGGVFHMTEVG